MNPDSLIGSKLGSYLVGEVPGRGATSTVYAGEHRLLGRKVALKVFELGVAWDTEFVRPVRELESLPSDCAILPVLDLAIDNETGLLYAVLPLADSDLFVFLGNNGRLDLHGVAQLAEELGDALDEIHAAGLVHGDVSSGNVLVFGRRAYLSDVGLVPPRPESPFVATIAYASPEVLRGESPTPRYQYSLCANQRGKRASVPSLDSRAWR